MYTTVACYKKPTNEVTKQNNMNTFRLISIIAISLLLSACSKSSERSFVGTVEDIVSKEALSSSTVKVFKNPYTASDSPILVTETNDLGQFEFSLNNDIDIRLLEIEKSNYNVGRISNFYPMDNDLKIGLFPNAYIRFEIIDSTGEYLNVKYRSPFDYFLDNGCTSSYDNFIFPSVPSPNIELIDSESDNLTSGQSLTKVLLFPCPMEETNLIIQRGIDTSSLIIETIELIRFDTITFELAY